MMNILIVKLSAIGDVIHTLPALNAIRKQYPLARITWLVESAAASLVKGHAALDRVLISKRKQWIKDISGSGVPFQKRIAAFKEARDFIRTLRDTEYDLIFDFQALLKSGVLIALARGKRKIGFDRGMEHMEHSYLFLNERIPPVDMEHHAITRTMMLLEAAGIRSDEIEYNIPVSEQDRAAVNQMLEQHGLCHASPLVAVNPMAKWDTKLWQEKKFAQVADMLIEQYQAGIVFTGGVEDVDVIARIQSYMKGNAVNFAGKTTLKMLAALYEKADFLVSTDTGPMHLSAAVGTPVVAIFGPTAPWRTGPFGNGHQVVRLALPCSPCFKRKCDTVDCMRRIEAEDVVEAVRGVWKQKGDVNFV